MSLSLLTFSQLEKLLLKAGAFYISIMETDRVETTYNLEGAGYNAYFSGDAHIWVLNTNCIFKMFSKRQQPEYRAFEYVINDSVASVVRRNEGIGQNVYIIPSTLQQISVGEFLQMKGKFLMKILKEL